MKRALRILRGVAIAAIALTLIAPAALYGLSERIIRGQHDVPRRAIHVPAGEAEVAEGRRLATIRGCNDGCHGKGVSGAEFWSEPWVGRLVAPDLSRIAATHSDAELERVIRHGVRRDGTSTFGMPSSMFHHLSDADLGLIIAFLRAQPTGNGPETEVLFGPLGRFELIRNPHYAYAREITQDAPWLTPKDLQGKYGRGRYLAATACTECHGMELKGDDSGSTPNLVVVGAYSQADFARLMKSGIAIGKRQLEMMSGIARTRFSKFNDEEVQALYGYLLQRAQDPRSHE